MIAILPRLAPPVTEMPRAASDGLSGEDFVPAIEVLMRPW